MIIFTPIKDIPAEYLIEKGISDIVRLNLTSYYADIPNLSMLIPSINYIPENVLSGDCADPTFDIAYHGYILSNDNAFIELMSIMVPEYINPGTLVQILISVSDYRDIIAESLMKLIQQRYGHNCYYVKDLEDFLYIEEQDYNIPGLFALDKDIERWRIIMNSMGGSIA